MSENPHNPAEKTAGEPARSFGPRANGRAVHVPVMLREVLKSLDLQEGVFAVDGTIGAGGHSREILKAIGTAGQLWGFDRDPMMLGHAAQAVSGPQVQLHQGNYVTLQERLQEWQTETQTSRQVDRLLLDLGYSSDQLADRSRGFSFQEDGPLDLRFSTTDGLSAAQRLMEATVEEVLHALNEYGEEPAAYRLAPAMIEAAKAGRLKTTQDLVRVVTSATPAAQLRNQDKHPATRVFQALRIWVNAELEHVERMLNQVAPACLAPGAIFSVITFHSLEDRLAKQAFKNRDVWEEVTAKPLLPSPAEVRFNPRSRSAKLRVARRKHSN